MLNSIRTALRVATGVVVIAGFLSLGTTQEFDGSLVLIPLILFAIMPICEQLDEQFHGYRIATAVLNVLVLPIVVAAPFYLGLLNAVIMLVIYIQVYLVLHRKRERDYYYLYLMAFFLLVASCVLSPEASIGIVMLIFLISSIWAFLILQIFVETERNQNATTPDLLALHEEDYQVVAPAGRWLDAGLILPVSGLCVLSVMLTVALFVFTPRMEAGFLGRREPTQFRTGLSNEVSIPTSGEIEADPRIVLRVEFPEEPGGRYDGEFFWRSSAFDTYTGSRWIRRHLAPDFDDALPDADFRSPVEENATIKTLVRTPSRNGRMVKQVVFLDDVPQDGLPCLSLVTRLDFEPKSKDVRLSWGDDNDFSIRFASAGSSSITYAAWSEVESDVSAEMLRAARNDYDQALGPQDYRQLLDQDLSPATQELAREITADATTPYDKVRALERWFQSDIFAYSLSIPPLNKARPIDDFVLNYKIGHCQLYATAMALMLRSVGIPSRVVSGYRGAEWIENEEAYVVRADMAHLWVEVYFLDLGWFSFDPSPPVDRSLTTMSSALRWFSLLSLRAKMLWFSEVVGFSGFQLADIKALSIGWLTDDSPLTNKPGSVRRSSAPFSAGLVFLLASVIAFLAYCWHSWRNRGKAATRLALSLHQLRARRLFFLVRKRLQQVGLIADGKTAEELAEVVAQYPPEPQRSLIEALHVYNEARFGGRALTTEQLGRLKNGLRDLKRQIARS